MYTVFWDILALVNNNYWPNSPPSRKGEKLNWLK